MFQLKLSGEGAGRIEPPMTMVQRYLKQAGTGERTGQYQKQQKDPWAGRHYHRASLLVVQGRHSGAAIKTLRCDVGEW